MSTFNGWTVVTMPSFPAPRDIQWGLVTRAAMSVSPFVGKQQIQNWNGRTLKMTFTMPLMNRTTARPWQDFIVNMDGIVNVCQLTAACFSGIDSLVPDTSPTGYWRLARNDPGWSVGLGFIFGFTFDLIEAK